MNVGPPPNFAKASFAALATKKFEPSAPRNCKEPASDISALTVVWNENSRQFVWAKSAEEILEQLASRRAAINADA
jgi:hypothetical protein